MKSIIKQSKSVEDAIKDALLELKAKEEDVEIEVIEEASKGLFGLIGAKEAKVRVTLVNDIVQKSDDFLSKLFSSMDIEATNNIRREDDILYIDIEDVNPRDKGIVIGKRGNTLDAIQYLLSLHINKGNSDYIKILLDIEGYREKRKQTLISLANRMADKAKESSRPIKLEPMNPYERRIIHASLQNYEGITTYSEGKEPYRRIVIQSKNR